MRYPLLSTFVVAALGRSAVAQFDVPGSSYVLGEGNGAPSEPYGMTTVADLDGDGFDDMAVLVGDDLMLLFSPALYEVLVPDILGGINDLVGVPAGRPHGKDTIAVVGAQGAGLLGWDGNDFTHRIVGAGWAGALRVDVVPRVGLEARQLIGVMADGLTVRRLTEDLGDLQGPWIDSFVCTRSSPILELALANLDGADEPEIGLMGASGVEIRDGFGGVLASFDFTGSAIALNRVRGNTSTEWLAVLGAGSGALGDPFIATLGPGGFLRSSSFAGDPQFVGMAAADLDASADGMDDLVLSYKSGHDVVYLENFGNNAIGPIFDPSLMGALRYIPMGPQGSAPANEATPATIDFDNDGDADILHPIQQDGTFFVFLSAGVDQDEMKPVIDTRFPSRFVPGPNIVLETVLAVDASVTTPSGSAPDVLEVFLYRRPDIDSPMSVAPLFMERYPVADAVLSRGEYLFPCAIPLDDSALFRCTHFEALYFLVARLAVEEQGGITERCPTRLLGIQGQVDGSNAQYLQDHSSTPENQVVVLHGCAGAATVSGVGGAGGVQPGPPLQMVTLSEEIGGSGDELDCLPKPTAGNKPPSLAQ